jgi:hypothetical protein
MSDALRGEATLQLKNISLGDFDPLQLMARHAGWGTLEPARGEADLGSAVLTLLVRDRRISLRTRPLELAGAKLLLAGTCRFDGTLDLGVEADFQHLKRRWLAHEAGGDSDVRRAHLHLAGHLDKVVVTPGMQLSRITP